MREDKSFVYDLNVQRGIVSSRVALLLRSAEIKPLLSDLFVFYTTLLSILANRSWLVFRRLFFLSPIRGRVNAYGTTMVVV